VIILGLSNKLATVLFSSSSSRSFETTPLRLEIVLIEVIVLLQAKMRMKTTILVLMMESATLEEAVDGRLYGACVK
jgi:hypothetical protein